MCVVDVGPRCCDEMLKLVTLFVSVVIRGGVLRIWPPDTGPANCGSWGSWNYKVFIMCARGHASRIRRCTVRREPMGLKSVFTFWSTEHRDSFQVCPPYPVPTWKPPSGSTVYDAYPSVYLYFHSIDLCRIRTAGWSQWPEYLTYVSGFSLIFAPGVSGGWSRRHMLQSGAQKSAGKLSSLSPPPPRLPDSEMWHLVRLLCLRADHQPSHASSLPGATFCWCNKNKKGHRSHR